MKLRLHNILKVASADIQLGGLTVITGINDSGKSSIGKILFSLLKSMNIVHRVDRYQIVRNIAIKILHIRKMFNNEKFKSLYLNMDMIGNDLIDGIVPFEEFCNEIMNQTKLEEGFSTRKRFIVRGYLLEIQNLLEEFRNPELAVKREFDAIVQSEFKESLQSYGTTNSFIRFHDDTADAYGCDIEIAYDYDNLSDFRLSGTTSIEDVTYIESPVYLHILDTLRRSGSMSINFSRLHNGNIPYHLSDMAEKILNETSDYIHVNNLFGNYMEPFDEIRELVDGDFIKEDETDQLYFHRDGAAFPMVSVASGIKSFGLLLQLLKTGNISTSKMLILDEPEIHLHPEWQIKFCKVIIELVSQGVPIVVSSHSPYFIQGLRYFAAKMGIEKEVTYYMAENSINNNLSSFVDVTNDLNSVFMLLAAPLHEIMNVDSVRSRKK